MAELTDNGRRKAAEVAERHGFTAATAEQVLLALRQGNGSQAQFNVPELGGLGQWSRGGMLMIGDMFNSALKARVDAFCSDLSGLVGESDLFLSERAGGGSSVDWPAELGQASASGAQNDMRYAVFPGTRRLAVARGGKVTIYDTGEHVIGGVSQAQSGGRDLTFSSQHGPISLDDLPVVRDAGNSRETSGPASARDEPPARSGESSTQAAADPKAKDASASPGDPVHLIERLAELHARGILSDSEFAQKKSEILGRL